MLKTNARRLTRKGVTERIEKGGSDMKKILKIAIPVTIAVVIAVLLLVFLLPRPVGLLKEDERFTGDVTIVYNYLEENGTPVSKKYRLPADGEAAEKLAASISDVRYRIGFPPAEDSGRMINISAVADGKTHVSFYVGDAGDISSMRSTSTDGTSADGALYGGRDAAEKLIDDILALVQPYEE